jgi:hypothetical protein
VMAVSLVQMAPHALPDPFAVAIFVGTLVAVMAWRIGVIKLLLGGAVLGMVRSRVIALPGVKAAF